MAVARCAVRESFAVARTVAGTVHQVDPVFGRVASVAVAVAHVVYLADGATDSVAHLLLSFRVAPVAVASVVAAVAVAAVVSQALSSVAESVAVAVVPSAVVVEPVAR